MPNIRGQTILSDGWEVDTTDYGKRRVALLALGGNDWRLTFYWDDVQINQQTLNNPSVAQVLTAVFAGLFPGAPVSGDGKTVTVDVSLRVSLHIFSLNPLTFALRTDGPGSVIPANWWQT